MKQDIAVFGLGAFGRNLVQDLVKEGHKVVAVDCNKDRIESVKEVVAEAIIGDLSVESVIKELDPAKFDIIILDLGKNLEALILCVTYLQNEEVKRIIAKVSDPIHRNILNRLGIQETVVPDLESATRLADRITTPNIVEMFEIENGCLAKVCVPKRLAGTALKELGLREKFDISAILIRKKGMKKDHMLFKHDFVLDEGDQLTVLGEEQKIHDAFCE